jgi:23S rRNA pseudouridine2604 synthase
MTINSFLVRKLRLSNQQVKEEIESGKVSIDNEKAKQKQTITALNTITFNGKVIQIGKQHFYYAYYKPVGVESTLNKEIKNNLIEATGIESYFFPIGRLDKSSEGLMILTNDGALYQQITNQSKLVEKIYEVKINQPISDQFINQMAAGIKIMGKFTQPCIVSKINNHKFKITLIEGRNRQIRRMCYQLGVEVIELKRTAIGKLKLEELAANSLVEVSKGAII